MAMIDDSTQMNVCSKLNTFYTNDDASAHLHQYSVTKSSIIDPATSVKFRKLFFLIYFSDDL